MRNGCALELTLKLCVLCTAVFIGLYPGENCITFVTAQINCAVANVADCGVKRNSEFSGLLSGILRHVDDICTISGIYAAQNGSFFYRLFGDKLLTTVFKGQVWQEEFLLEILDL